MIQDSRFRNGNKEGMTDVLYGLLSAHHAYAVRGDVDSVRTTLWDFFEKNWGVETRGNPDFLHACFAMFTIDDARMLRGRAEQRAFETGRKIFVIEAETITPQAQNGLLKLFEEPTEHTHFFLIGRGISHLIPTLRSRLVTIETPYTLSEKLEAAGEFLRSSVPARLALVKKLTDDIKNEKKTKADALALVENMEALLYQKGKEKNALPAKLLEDVELCRDYMRDPSASVKMLLEYLSLIAPKT